MKKRLLAGLLALAMLFTMLPTAAFAASGLPVAENGSTIDIKVGETYEAFAGKIPQMVVSCPYCKGDLYTATPDARSDYLNPSITASNPSVVSNLSYDWATTQIPSDPGHNYEAITLRFTGAEAGTTTIQVQYRLYFYIPSFGYWPNYKRCNKCGEQVSFEGYSGYNTITRTFTVNVIESETTNYTLSYDGNGEGSSNVPAADTYTGTESKHEFTVSNIEPTRKGYTFLGWADTADAMAATYVADDTITLLQAAPTKTIYAVWQEKEPEETYTVTYTDGANGEVFKDQVTNDLKSGTTTPEFVGNTEREGYVFAGWSPEVAKTVTGNATYTATWKEDKNGNGIADDEEGKYTVTYTDGIATEEVFADQVYSDLLSGDATPVFNGTPARTGYVFAGWDPTIAEKVTADAIYTATWKEDKNGNGIADDEEGKYTVTYTDGIATEEVFADQVYSDLLSGDATPVFNGTPARTGYVFAGWDPTIAEKVTADAIYTATWKEDKNGNGIADDEEGKYTITYTDGIATEEVFADQVYSDLLSGDATPAFNGTPTRTGYVFAGWDPAIAEKVTADATYTAQWDEVKPEPRSINVNYNIDLEKGNFVEDRDKATVAQHMTEANANEFSILTVEAKEGYKFAGWHVSGAEEADLPEDATLDDVLAYVFYYNDEGNVSVTALFEEIEPEVRNINVNYNIDLEKGEFVEEGGKAAITQRMTTATTDEFSILTVEAKEGYKFAGWHVSGAEEADLPKDATLDDVLAYVFYYNNEGNVAVTAVFENEAPVETEQIIYVHFDIFDGEWTDSVPAENSKQFVLRSSTADAELEIPAVVAPAGKTFDKWENNIGADLTLSAAGTFTYNDLADYVTFDADGNAYIGFTAVFEDETPVEDEQTITVNFTIFDGEWTDSVPAENSKQFVLRSSTADAELEIPAVVAPAGKTFDKWENNIGADLTLGAVGTFTYNDLAEYVTFDADGNAYIGFTAAFKDAAPVVPGDEDKPTETDSSIGALVGTGVVLAGGAAALTYYYREALPIWKYAAIVKLADDTPVQNAAVTLIQDGETVKTVTTDDNGYIQTRVAKGTYQVVVTWERDGVQYTAHTEATVERMAGDIQPQEIVLALE